MWRGRVPKGTRFSIPIMAMNKSKAATKSWGTIDMIRLKNPRIGSGSVKGIRWRGDLERPAEERPSPLFMLC